MERAGLGWVGLGQGRRDTFSCNHLLFLSPPPFPPLILQVRPLRRHLTGLKAWITGQRKDQSPGTRMAVPVVQVSG